MGVMNVKKKRIARWSVLKPSHCLWNAGKKKPKKKKNKEKKAEKKKCQSLACEK